MVWAWMGDGVSNPTFSTALTTGLGRPSVSKLVPGVSSESFSSKSVASEVSATLESSPPGSSTTTSSRVMGLGVTSCEVS